MNRLVLQYNAISMFNCSRLNEWINRTVPLRFQKVTGSRANNVSFRPASAECDDAAVVFIARLFLRRELETSRPQYHCLEDEIPCLSHQIFPFLSSGSSKLSIRSLRQNKCMSTVPLWGQSISSPQSPTFRALQSTWYYRKSTEWDRWFWSCKCLHLGMRW